MNKIILCLSLVIASSVASAQKGSITYELNGRVLSNEKDENSRSLKNPFANFIGEWTLKNDDWSQNWGGGKEMIKIPKHHTASVEVNTRPESAFNN